MKKVLAFIKATRRASKILFVLWILTSAIICKNPDPDFSSLMAPAVFFFVPAIVIECRKNPVLKEIKRSTKILLVLWVLFSISGDGDIASYLISIPISTMLFFIPAVVIEY